MIDFMSKSGGQGAVAKMIAENGRLNAHAMRPFIGDDGLSYITTFSGRDWTNPDNYGIRPINANATLRRDEWKQLDEALVPIAESRLNGVQDLISNGLTYNLGNAMGTTVLENHDVSDALEAELTMDAITRTQGDRPTYGTNYLPIPIIHVDYEINMRELAASRSLGNPIDTTLAERAARKVAEKLEKMLFTATSYAFGGGTIYSYINYTNRNTGTFTAWNGSGKTAAQILKDVQDMKQDAINAHFYGPYALYVPSTYETVLDNDYDTTKSNTIRERLMKLSNIKIIKTVDTLTDGNIVLVQLTKDVVRLVRGMGIQNIQWQEQGNFVSKYKVMTIQVPQIRSDQDGNCGIVHYSTS